MDRIKAQKMGIGFHRTQIIDGDHLDIGSAALDDGPQDVAADAAESVDGDFDGHEGLLLNTRDSGGNC